MPPIVRHVLCGAILLAVGCGKSEPQYPRISGKVTFKGAPVPAGFILLIPDAGSGTLGKNRMLTIKDDQYDSATERKPNVPAGSDIIQIHGFNGQPEQGYTMGKQIFNAVGDRLTKTADDQQKDFEVPESAGRNVVYVPNDENI